MVDFQDLRKSDRYLILDKVIGTFAAAEVQVTNISEEGAQISHVHPLRIATRGRLIFKRGTVSVNASGLVMWSKLSKTPDEHGKYLYSSGIRIEEGASTFATSIQGLAEQGIIRRDADSLDRKRRQRDERQQAKTGGPAMRRVATQDISPDTALLVAHARERLRTNPDEAQKWFSRAYFAIQQGQVPLNIEQTQHREDVLAVWEYLERTVPLPVILKIFEGKA